MPSNLIIIYGAQPSKHTIINRDLQKSFIEHLNNRYCRDTLSISFPRVLQRIANDNEDVELVTSRVI